MNTQLVVLQGDITQLKVDTIVARDSIWASPGESLRLFDEASGQALAAEGARLGAAYRNALSEAAAGNSKSIAFPDPEEGMDLYPRTEAAEIALKEVRQFILDNPGRFTEIIFACWDSENYHLYKGMLGSEIRAINIP